MDSKSLAIVEKPHQYSNVLVWIGPSLGYMYTAFEMSSRNAVRLVAMFGDAGWYGWDVGYSDSRSLMFNSDSARVASWNIH